MDWQQRAQQEQTARDAPWQHWCLAFWHNGSVLTPALEDALQALSLAELYRARAVLQQYAAGPQERREGMTP